MQYANGQAAKKHDLIVFTDNSSVKDYDAVGIVVDVDSARNVRPLARLSPAGWTPTSDHVTCVALETAMPMPELAGLMEKSVAAEEITECAKEQFRPGRALAHGVCERCLHHFNEHPWKKSEPVPAQEEAAPKSE